jgi:hypothetical protein
MENSIEVTQKIKNTSISNRSSYTTSGYIPKGKKNQHATETSALASLL